MTTDALTEAMRGSGWRARVYRATCSACHGSGGADSGTLRCGACDGKGSVWAVRANGGRCCYCDAESNLRNSLDPRFRVCGRCEAWIAAGNPVPQRGPCPKCKGEGSIDCSVCHNEGDEERGCLKCDGEGGETCSLCQGTKTRMFYQRETEGDDE